MKATASVCGILDSSLFRDVKILHTNTIFYPACNLQTRQIRQFEADVSKVMVSEILQKITPLRADNMAVSPSSFGFLSSKQKAKKSDKPRSVFLEFLKGFSEKIKDEQVGLSNPNGRYGERSLEFS